MVLLGVVVSSTRGDPPPGGNIAPPDVIRAADPLRRAADAVGRWLLGEGSEERPAVDVTPRQPARPKITISKETTWIEGPLRPDGYVDYAEALNRRYGKGVTPENNVAIPLWRATGPGELDQEIREPFFRRLGMEPLADDGKYLERLEDYIEHRPDTPLAGLDEAEQEQWWERLWVLEEHVRRAPWSGKDYPWAAAWLEANRRPLATFVAGTTRPRYFSPSLASPRGSLVDFNDGSFAELVGTRRAVRMLVSRAMLQLHEGQIDEAWQDLAACYRFARLKTQGPFVLDQILATAYNDMAFVGNAALAGHEGLSAKQARRFAADLQQLAPPPQMADVLDAGERFFELDALHTIARQDPKYLDLFGVMRDESWCDALRKLTTDPRMDWDEVLRLANAGQTELVDALRTMTCAQRRAFLKREFRKANRRGRKASSPAAVKRVLAEGTSPKRLAEHLFRFLSSPGVLSSDRHFIYTAIERIEMQTEIGRLAFCLAAYRCEHDAYPETLEQLCPQYATEIPVDVFSGGKLHYKPTEQGFVLYSVGPNLRDDGGRGQWSQPEQGDDEEIVRDDIVIRVPVE